MTVRPTLRSVHVDGTSMDRAGLHDGETVFMRPCETARHGDVVVVRQGDGTLTIKRYYQGRPVDGFEGGWLLPDSSDRRWEPRPLWDGDRIVGVIVGLPERDRSHLLARPVLVPASELPPREVPPHHPVLPHPDTMIRGDVTPDYAARCEREDAWSEARREWCDGGGAATARRVRAARLRALEVPAPSPEASSVSPP